MANENELSTEVLQLAQEWRDRAFGSAHMSKLKSDTLEECAAELDALLAPQEVTEAMHAAMTRALQQVEIEAPREPSEGVRLMVEQAVLDRGPMIPHYETAFRDGVERGLAMAATALSLAREQTERAEARRLAIAGFEPVTESTPGYFVGDALGIARDPDAIEDTERLYDSAYSPGHDELRDVLQLCEQADAEVTKGPHGFIQWKGTQVCMDVHCSCGELTHVHSTFAHTVECGACGRLWAVCSHVRFVEITRVELHNRCTPVLSEVLGE